MRKIFLLFLFMFNFASAEINEYVSDVYFANGIDTNEDDAKDSLDEIDLVFESTHPQAYQYVAKWDVSYNHTHGIGIDFYESMLQKIDERWYTKYVLEVSGLLDYSFKGLVKMVVKKVAKEKIKEQAEKYAVQIAEKLIAKYGYEYGGLHFTKGDIVAIFASGLKYAVEQATDAFLDVPEEIIRQQEAADIEKQFNAYTQSIKDGHGVVVIAHSQGNLFTNLAYDMFENHWIPWNEDTEWMKPYFTAMAVASPANDILGKSGPSITFENDIIQLVPDSLPAIEPNPTKYYYYNATIGERLEVRYSIEAHAFLTSYMATDTTRTKILSFINEGIVKHKEKPSQWTPKNKGCLCKEKYAKMTHMYDPATMDSYLANEKVKDFAESSKGKIYKADAGEHAEYVRALDGDRGDDGVFTIEEVKEDDICFVLKDDVAGEVGSVKGANAMAVPESGIIGISLGWDDADVNLSLSSAIGTKDITATECPFEHYFARSEADVKPGTYGVYVSHSGEVEDESLPQSVKINIHAPGAALVFDLNITAADMLNLGHVANIIISEKKTISATAAAIGEDSIKGIITCYGNCPNPSGTYVQYLYEIQSKLKQALLGPLSAASINLTHAEDFANSVPFYESSTSGGDSIVTAGLFYFTDEALALLEPDTYYVMSVVGGNDIDANDDGMADTTPTPNLGSIHAVVSTDTLTNANFKTNILTEVAFQLTQELMTQELNTTALQERLDDIARRLLEKDVDGNKEVNYNDLLAWIPTVDKDKLRKPYATFYEPIAQNIYKNEAIYDDAYALVYEPFVVDVFNLSKEYTQVGILDIVFIGNSIETITLSGEGSSDFTIDANGVIRVAQGVTLDVSRQGFYALVAYINDTIAVPVTITLKSRILSSLAFGRFVVVEDVALSPDETKAYVATNTGLHIIDIVNPASPTIASFVDIPSFFRSFVLSSDGTKAYIETNLESESSLYVVDVSDSGSPTIASTLNLSDLYHLTISDDATKLFAYWNTYDGNKGLKTIDISDVGSATEIASISTNEFINGIYLSTDNTKAYVAGIESGLQIIDVSNPLDSVILASTALPSNAQDIAFSSDNTKAYVATGESGLQIIDVSDPSFPSIVASVDTPGFANSITLSSDGTKAYVADDRAGLQIIDVSDPSFPSIVASVDTPGFANSITLSSDGTKAFVADGMSGLQIIDVSGF